MISKSVSHTAEASTKAPRLPSATRRVAEGTGLPSLVGNRAITRAITREPGAPLPSALRKSMESRFGQDFSSVRVHTDADAAAADRANAFTIGEQIVFGHGRYRPDQADGQALIAHELAHVVQQRRGGEDPAAGPAVEQDANDAAGAAMTGQPVAVAQGGAPAVARQGDDDNPYLRAAISRHLASQYQLHLDQDLVSSLAPPLPVAGAPPLPLTEPASPMAPPPPINALTFKPPGPRTKPRKPKTDDDDDDLPGSELIYPGMRRIKSGSPSDILKAVSKVPEVDALGSAAGDKAQHDFGKLSTPEKVLLPAYGALLAGTAAGIGYGTKDPTLSKGLLGGVGALGGPLIGAGLHKLGLPLDADLSLFSNLGKPTPPKPDIPQVPPSLPGFEDQGQGFLLKLKGKF